MGSSGQLCPAKCLHGPRSHRGSRRRQRSRPCDQPKLGGRGGGGGRCEGAQAWKRKWPCCASEGWRCAGCLAAWSGCRAPTPCVGAGANEPQAVGIEVCVGCGTSSLAVAQGSAIESGSRHLLHYATSPRATVPVSSCCVAKVWNRSYPCSLMFSLLYTVQLLTLNSPRAPESCPRQPISSMGYRQISKLNAIRRIFMRGRLVRLGFEILQQFLRRSELQ